MSTLSSVQRISARERAGTPAEQAVRFWMSAPVVTVHFGAQISEALARMHEHSVRRLPVVDDHGKLCGMITDGDIRGAEVMRTAGIDLLDIATTLRHTTVYEVMTEHPISITPDTSLRDAALLMIDNKIGGLPVVNDDEVIGIVTESDLFEALVCYLDRESNST